MYHITGFSPVIDTSRPEGGCKSNFRLFGGAEAFIWGFGGLKPSFGGLELSVLFGGIQPPYRRSDGYLGVSAMPIYAYRHSMGHIKNSPQETVGANRPKNGKHVQLC